MQLSSSLPSSTAAAAGLAGAASGVTDDVGLAGPAAPGDLAFAQLFSELAGASPTTVNSALAAPAGPPVNREGPGRIAGWRGNGSPMLPGVGWAESLPVPAPDAAVAGPGESGVDPVGAPPCVVSVVQTLSPATAPVAPAGTAEISRPAGPGAPLVSARRRSPAGAVASATVPAPAGNVPPIGGEIPPRGEVGPADPKSGPGWAPTTGVRRAGDGAEPAVSLEAAAAPPSGGSDANADVATEPAPTKGEQGEGEPSRVVSAPVFPPVQTADAEIPQQGGRRAPAAVELKPERSDPETAARAPAPTGDGPVTSGDILPRGETEPTVPGSGQGGTGAADARRPSRLAARTDLPETVATPATGGLGGGAEPGVNPTPVNETFVPVGPRALRAGERSSPGADRPTRVFEPVAAADALAAAGAFPPEATPSPDQRVITRSSAWFTRTAEGRPASAGVVAAGTFPRAAGSSDGAAGQSPDFLRDPTALPPPPATGQAWPQDAAVPLPMAPAMDRAAGPTATPVPPAQARAASRPTGGAEPFAVPGAVDDASAYREKGDGKPPAEVLLPAKRGGAVVAGARTVNPPVGRAANLAAVYAENLPTVAADENETSVIFLRSSPELVTDGESALGTGVAKLVPAMSASTFPRQPSSAVGEHVSPLSPAILTGELPRPVAGSTAAAVASAAQRAVNTVLEATDRFAAGSAQAVNLQFSVAGSELSVRVELRDGEVRATFRTDSTELRTALAQEWQTMSGSEAGRPLRAIDPVFAPAKTAGSGATSGESAPQQHREARQSGDPTPSRQPGPPAPSSFASSDPVAPAPRPAPLATALRLHTFA